MSRTPPPRRPRLLSPGRSGRPVVIASGVEQHAMTGQADELGPASITSRASRRLRRRTRYARKAGQKPRRRQGRAFMSEQGSGASTDRALTAPSVPRIGGLSRLSTSDLLADFAGRWVGRAVPDYAAPHSRICRSLRRSATAANRPRCDGFAVGVERGGRRLLGDTCVDPRAVIVAGALRTSSARGTRPVGIGWRGGPSAPIIE